MSVATKKMFYPVNNMAHYYIVYVINYILLCYTRPHTHLHILSYNMHYTNHIHQPIYIIMYPTYQCQIHTICTIYYENTHSISLSPTIHCCYQLETNSRREREREIESESEIDRQIDRQRERERERERERIRKRVREFVILVTIIYV